jgi:16S rRNA (adenine1518-N6/adenine1519-N6)-dimethyltransferase
LNTIANIPYYITGALLRSFLEAQYQPSEIVFLMQKEVADRIVKKDGKESLLSLSVGIFGEPHFIKKVPSSAFSPSPKIDSAILHIKNIHKGIVSPEKINVFFTIAKAGFAHKRKTLQKKPKRDSNGRKCLPSIPNMRS